MSRQKHFLFLLCFTFFSYSKSIAQFNNIISSVNIGVNSQYLEEGDIKVYNTSIADNVPIKYSIGRYADATSKTLVAKAIFIIDILGAEYAVSDTIQISNADFTGTSVGSKILDATITLQPNSKIGIVKLKYTEQIDGTWSAFKYSQESIRTTYGRSFYDIQGPDKICTEETYKVNYTEGLTFEGNGIATVASLGNGEYKISRIGTNSGIITFSSKANGKQYTKTIEIGAYTVGTITGNANLKKGESLTYSIPLNGNLDYLWSCSNPYVTITKTSANTVKLSTTSNMPAGYSAQTTLYAKAVTNCGTATNYVSKSILLSADLDPRLD
ncbi:hypothetical protein [Sphingobacterium sp. LRF_L2]|uniref:hypothetical protein n=1 Tax=Sphingobacterium sp. LRF_L2 TaxID=3369421 RepID=UPI003F62B856